MPICYVQCTNKLHLHSQAAQRARTQANDGEKTAERAIDGAVEGLSTLEGQLADLSETATDQHEQAEEIEETVDELVVQ